MNIARSLAVGLICATGAFPACSETKMDTTTQVGAEAPLPTVAEQAIAAGAAREAHSSLRQRLAQAYHVERCVMTGRVAADPGRFVAAGWTGRDQFAAAWDAEATAAPAWSASVVRDDFRIDCVQGDNDGRANGH
jgi:hypothetical protein